ncbi:NlpC/P60 family protein [Streptomyces sp. CC224B]|uniref:C40 family peptidase n=1 Tax=Streptomyces sp. CC224B TaxID=3044571 RepID=UPI0024A986DD|nr:NlpC/P60 family protein [Streptomyces sp. CC224B]
MRKTWLLAAVAFGGSLGFLMLLVVGTFVAAGSLAGNGSGGSVGLAKGAVPSSYQGLVQKWGNLCKAINPALLAAQLYQESGFNPRAKSPARAQGIAQFIPGTWATHGIDGDGDGDRDVWDPEDAIPSAASYDCELAKYVKDAPGDPTKNMLAAYNAGAYAVIKYGGVPPYRETQNYVKIITTLEKSFARPVGRVNPSQQAAGAIYYAQKKLGTLYLWGGNGTPEQGGRFDCSGLTLAAYRSVGIDLPRVANDQYNVGPHPKRDELLPGDLVFFSDDLSNPRAIRHVGIYVGGGYMINAPRPGAKIRFDPIDTPDYFGATRVTEDGAKAVPSEPPEERDEESEKGRDAAAEAGGAPPRRPSEEPSATPGGSTGPSSPERTEV